MNGFDVFAAMPDVQSPLPPTPSVALASLFLPDHVYVVDETFRFTYINPAGLQAFGRTLGEVLYHVPEDVFPSSLAAQLRNDYERVFSTGDPVLGDADFVARDGRVYHFAYTLAPIPSADGARSLIGTTRDATEQKNLLTELSLRDRAIAAAAGGIVISDPNLPDMPIVFANAGFEGLTGYGIQEAIGRNCRFLQGVNTDRGAVAQIRDAIATRTSARVTLRNYRKDGTPFWSYLEISPVLDAEGGCSHYIGVQTDVSERVRTQEALATSYAREERIARMLQGTLLLAPPDAFGDLYVKTQYQAALDEALIGGDFYDAFALPGGKIALVVGDVAGKGLPAAAQIAETKYALRVFLKETPSDPAGALERLNRYLILSRSELGAFDPTHFIAIGLVVVDRAACTASILAAGMESPCRVRPADRSVVGSPHFGTALGILQPGEYEAHVVPFGAGDYLLLATDGITEARRAGQQLFLETGGAASLLLEAAVGTTVSHETVRRLSERVLQGARQFAGGAFQDDACLIVAGLAA